MISIGNKEVTEVWMGSTPVQEIWIGSNKVFPTSGNTENPQSTGYDLSSPRIVHEVHTGRDTSAYDLRDDFSYKLDSDMRNLIAYYSTFFRGDFDVYIDANLGLDNFSDYSAVGFYKGEEKVFEVRVDSDENAKLIQKNKAPIYLNNSFSLIKTAHEKNQLRKIQVKRQGTSITLYYYDRSFSKKEIQFESTDEPIAIFLEARGWNVAYIFSVSGSYTI